MLVGWLTEAVNSTGQTSCSKGRRKTSCKKEKQQQFQISEAVGQDGQPMEAAKRAVAELSFLQMAGASNSSIALYYISLLFGFGKYSIEWRPPICVCRLEMELLRPQYTKFDPFFLQNVKCPYVTSPPKKFGWLLLTFGGVWEAFCRGSVVSRNMWFAAENVVLMGNPYVLKGSSPFAEYVVCRGKCGLPRKMCHVFWRAALWQTVGEEFLNHHYVFILRDNVRKIIMKKKHR